MPKELEKFADVSKFERAITYLAERLDRIEKLLKQIALDNSKLLKEVKRLSSTAAKS
jgi:GTP cyclohydrolase I